MEVVKQRLNYEMIDDLVRRSRRRQRQGRYDCALYWTDRQELLVTLTEAAYRDGCRLVRRQSSQPLHRGVWRLRQAAAFSSFSIPDAGVNSNDWDARDPDRYRSQYERRLLRRERQIMEKYARCFGCDLILDPRIDKTAYADPGQAGSNCTGKSPLQEERDGPGSTLEEKMQFRYSAGRTARRLRLMIDFIEAHEDDSHIRVVVPKEKGQITTNLIIVGDWFAAEAVVPYFHSRGYERTIFTRHAPTVLNTSARFDQDFEDHLRGAGFAPDHPGTTTEAKAAALTLLRKCLAQIEKQESR